MKGNIESSRQALQAAAAEPWTVAAMMEAEPYPLPTVSPKTQAEQQAEVQTQAEAGLVAGGLPETAAPGPEAPTATSGGYNYPPPYTTYEVPEVLYQGYPWKTVGKIFFKQKKPDGTIGSFVASASSIGNYAIWTAGHCVHYGNGKPDFWSTNLVFVPAYRDGAAPFGQWRASYLITRTTWYQNGIPNGLTEDMGGAILFPLSGQKISQKVGWLGFAWNQGRYQHWHDFGYPARDPFNGQRMWCTTASYAYDGDVAGIKPVGIGCNQTPGCSGGPWIWKFLNNNYINGDNSYRRGDKPEEIHSPYFDDRAKALFDQLINGTP